MDLITFNTLLSWFVLATQVVTIILGTDLIFSFLPKKISSFVSKQGLWIAWSISIGALLGPLVYAEIFLFEPCKFCWLQRIFMFPIFFLLGTFHIRKIYSKSTMRDLFWYIAPLTLTGASISIYHYLLQFGYVGSASVGCGAVGQSIACNSLYILQLGYITIPLMALTAFISITILLGYSLKK